MTDQNGGLREIYSRHARAEGHLTEEAWERLALGGAGREERERLVDHVVRCAECAAVYRGLAELETEARGFDPGAPARPLLGQAGWQSGLRPWGFLGGMAAAAALVWALARPAMAPAPPPASAPPVMRGAESARPQPLAPVGRHTTLPAHFHWEPLPGARGYRVELLDAAGVAVWTSDEVAGTSVGWPAGIRVRPGTSYWQVVAVAPTGRAADAVTSPMASFEIIPE
jgi:hypothetical protein